MTVGGNRRVRAYVDAIILQHGRIQSGVVFTSLGRPVGTTDQLGLAALVAARMARAGSQRARPPDRESDLPRTGEVSPVRGADMWGEWMVEPASCSCARCRAAPGRCSSRRCSAVACARAERHVTPAVVGGDTEWRLPDDALDRIGLGETAANEARDPPRSCSDALRSDEPELRLASVTALGRLATATSGRSTASSRHSREELDNPVRVAGAARPAGAAARLAAAAAARASEQRRPLLRRAAARALRAARRAARPAHDRGRVAERPCRGARDAPCRLVR